MKTYSVTAPDGSIIEINGPDDATDEELIQVAMEEWQPEEPNGYLKGARDPVDGLSQMLYNALPEGVQEAGDDASRWLHDKMPSIFSPMPEGGFNEQLRQQEANYQATRAASGETGIDGDRIVGNIFSPANVVAASRGAQLAGKLGQAGSKAQQYARATGAGVTSAALQPTLGPEGDYWKQKGIQAGVGGLTGFGTQGLTNALSRVIKPNQSDAIRKLRSEGVMPTWGQAAGGALNKIEQKAMSVPILGDAIAANRNRAIDQLNRAAYSRALAPIGERLPKDVKPGADALQAIDDKLSAAYERVIPNLSGYVDRIFTGKLGQLQMGINRLDDKFIKKFKNVIEQDIEKKIEHTGRFSGETFKKIESQLGKEWRAHSGWNASTDERLYSNAIRQLQANLRELAARQNPEHAKILRGINRGWANYSQIANAVAKAGAQARGGQASPANFMQAVKKGSSDKMVSKGKAFNQDLHGTAVEMLGPNVPDSGTAGRVAQMAAGGAAVGGMGINPAMALPFMPYMPGLRSALPMAMSVGRGERAKATAETLRKAAPFLVPGFHPMVNGLLNPGQ